MIEHPNRVEREIASALASKEAEALELKEYQFHETRIDALLEYLRPNNAKPLAYRFPPALRGNVDSKLCAAYKASGWRVSLGKVFSMPSWMSMQASGPAYSVLTFEAEFPESAIPSPQSSSGHSTAKSNPSES